MEHHENDDNLVPDEETAEDIDEDEEEQLEYHLPDHFSQRVTILPDSFTGYDKKLFAMSERDAELIDSVVISRSQIKDRCNELAL